MMDELDEECELMAAQFDKMPYDERFYPEDEEKVHQSVFNTRSFTGIGA